MVNRGPRKVLDVNAPKRERQKPGPKPKPKPPPNRFLHDPASYVAPARKRPIVRYTDEQIVEVLQYLYYHKILDKKPDGTAGEVVPRYRSGTILQKRPELFVAPEGHRYRSPTYEEAADWFQIPKGTIIKWWNSKLSMIGIEPEMVPQAPMPDFLKQPRPSAAAAAGQLPLPAGQLPLPPTPGSGAASTGARSVSGSDNGAVVPGSAQVKTNGLGIHA